MAASRVFPYEVVKESPLEGLGEIRSILLEELERITEPLGMHVVELSVFRGKSGLNIRAVIYREGGVTLDDCERVTKLYNDRLTILEPIDENNYTLQVSSPGIYRVFKDIKEYTIFRSRHVKMVVDEPFEESDGGVLRGFLGDLKNDRVALVPDGDPGKTLSISLGSIRKIQLDG
jgi:ribosome maturation factor RimP